MGYQRRTVRSGAYGRQTGVGATEVWHFRAAPASHLVHLHLVHFKVLSRNGGNPSPTDAGWKDTVDLTSGEEACVLVRFDGYRGRYV
ncbi:MAG TPA: multicopper oxidase domain-containing protein, partial [Rubrobacter sp.]|nr:multicopper oxidase domain-containing protein [Rubrobacter sp.]